MYMFVYVRKQNVELHHRKSICIVRLGFLSLFLGGGDFLGNAHSIFKISSHQNVLCFELLIFLLTVLKFLIQEHCIQNYSNSVVCAGVPAAPAQLTAHCLHAAGGASTHQDQPHLKGAGR